MINITFTPLQRIKKKRNTKTGPQYSENHVSFSRTKVREMLKAGEKPSTEFSRLEVAEVLIEGMQE